MFCPSCGNELQDSDNFCSTCGRKVDGRELKSATEKVSDERKQVPLTFKEFKANKEKERAQHFRPPTKIRSKAKRKLTASEDVNTTVRINSGIMLFNGQELKNQRGKALVLSLKKTATAEEQLEACLDKHTAHSKNVIKPNAKYVILYSDGTKVEKLKEADEQFVLHKHKAECGKPYHRLTFFLCPEVDYSLATLQQCIVESSSDDSGDDLCPNVLKDEEGQHKSRKVENSDPAIVLDLSNSSPEVRSSVSTVPTCTNDENSKASSSQSNDHYASEYTTLSEMFPQLGDDKIKETLCDAHYNIEEAISNILETAALQTTPQQVYASFEFCNDIDSDEDFRNTDALQNCVDPLETENKEDSTNEVPISSMIRKLAAEKLKSDASLRVKVRRSNVWEDARFKIKKCSDSDLRNIIKVQFVGEPAVDEGGPRNEFYSLVHSEMSKSSLFIGEQDKKSFNHDILALERRDYYIYGQLCSMGILQGSPSPCFFTPTTADYIVFGKIEKVSTCITDVPNPKVRQKLEDWAKIKDPEVFAKVASFECPFRFKASFSKPVVTIEDKDKLFHAIALHYNLLTALSEINQFVEGLNLHGLLDHVRQHPLKARQLFLHTENQLTAEKVDDLFMPVFSPRGSNKRT